MIQASLQAESMTALCNICCLYKHAIAILNNDYKALSCHANANVPDGAFQAAFRVCDIFGLHVVFLMRKKKVFPV